MTATVSPTATAQRTSRRPSALELLRQPPVTPPTPAPQLPDLPPPVAPGFRFSPAQAAALAAPLDRAHVRQREQGRGRVSYLEGWQVIAEANRIFGFDGWQRQTVLLRCVAERPRKIGSEPRRPNDPPQRDGWGVTYIAKVRIAVGDLLREGTGAGHGIDVDLGLAHESALKEAETDATKRALMTFGNPFGLALYDKQQRQVSSSAMEQRTGAQCTSGPLTREPRARAEADPDPGMVPLDPATIHRIHNTLRSLPRPALEGFTQAFRKRFQVPAEVGTIADRINQKRHHDWIEAYLVQHPPSRPSEPGQHSAAGIIATSLVGAQR